MRFALKIYIVFILFVSQTLASPLPSEGRVLVVANSGSSFIVNLGSVHGLRLPLEALVLVKGEDLDLPRLIELGQGELLRIEGVRSYWHLKSKNNDVKLRVGDRLSFDFVETLNSGREELSFENRQIVSDISSMENEGPGVRNEEVPKYLLEHQDDYFSEKLEEKDEGPSDAHIIIKKKSKVARGQEVPVEEDRVQRRVLPLYSPVKDNSEARLVVNKVVAASLSQMRVENTNALKDNREELYEDNKVDSDSFESIFTENTEEESINKQKDDVQFNYKVKKEGGLWSAGLSDEDLRKKLIRLGVEDEKRRRRFILRHRPANEMNLFYSSSLVNHSNTEDESNQGNGYSYGLSYEYQLARASADLLNWSLEAGFEKGVDNIDMGGINSQVIYNSYFIGVNWYPYRPPTASNEVLFYIGTGYKIGKATIAASSLSNNYSYDLQAFPYMWAGIKMRLDRKKKFSGDSDRGFGLNGRIVSQSNRWTSNDTVDDNIETNLTVNDIKLHLAFSLFF